MKPIEFSEAIKLACSDNTEGDFSFYTLGRKGNLIKWTWCDYYGDYCDPSVWAYPACSRLRARFNQDCVIAVATDISDIQHVYPSRLRDTD